MAHQSLFDKAVVIKFLRENQSMSPGDAADFLTKAGMPISRTSVTNIRRENHIPYKRESSAKDIVEKWHREGKEITVKSLKKQWPDMTIAYAQKLVATYAPVERQLKKCQPVEVAPIRVEETPFLITKVGALTRYELR